MSELEKIIRNMMDNGTDAGSIAQHLGDTLNKVEKEHKEAEAAKERELKAQRESIEKSAYKRQAWINKAVERVDGAWNDLLRDYEPRDTGLFAAVTFAERKENEDWTAEDLEQFADTVTKNVEIIGKLMAGHKTVEDRTKEVIETLKKEVGGALKRVKPGFDFNMVSEKNPLRDWTMGKVESADEILKNWLKEMGW